MYVYVRTCAVRKKKFYDKNCFIITVVTTRNLLNNYVHKYFPRNIFSLSQNQFFNHTMLSQFGRCVRVSIGHWERNFCGVFQIYTQNKQFITQTNKCTTYIY